MLWGGIGFVCIFLCKQKASTHSHRELETNDVVSVRGIGEFLRVRVYVRSIGSIPDTNIGIGASLINSLSPFRWCSE